MPPAKKKAPAKKAPAKKAPAKKKAAPKPEFLLEVEGHPGDATLAFLSETIRDAALKRLQSHVGMVSKGLAYSIKDDAGNEFRYLKIKSVSKK